MCVNVNVRECARACVCACVVFVVSVCVSLTHIHVDLKIAWALSLSILKFSSVFFCFGKLIASKNYKNIINSSAHKAEYGMLVAEPTLKLFVKSQ